MEDMVALYPDYQGCEEFRTDQGNKELLTIPSKNPCTRSLVGKTPLTPVLNLL